MRKTILITLLALSLFSCKKPVKDDPCTPSTATIAGSYKITAMTYKRNATGQEIDYIPIVFPDACQRDDMLTFNTNGSYELIDAGMVCSPSGSDNGTWSSSGTNMTIDGEPNVIESFDCKTLVVIETDIDTPGDRLKITLTKQ